MSIQEDFENFLKINKEIYDTNKIIKEKKKLSKQLEEKIYNYMIENSMDSISLNSGQIILYEKKIPQTFKKPSIIDKLTENLECTEEQADKIAESILTNKVYITAPKIKCNIKKSKN